MQSKSNTSSWHCSGKPIYLNIYTICSYLHKYSLPQREVGRTRVSLAIQVRMDILHGSFDHFSEIATVENDRNESQNIKLISLYTKSVA